MATFLITGIAGFIGSALARKLIALGHTVRGLDNFSTGKQENLEGVWDQLEIIRADLLEPGALAAACRGIDYVLAEAAIPSVPQSVADPVGCSRTNVEGTVELLWRAHQAGVKRVVYAASCAAYGDSRELPKRECLLPQPQSPYGVSKVAGEMYVAAFHHCYGMETVALRYFNVFGPRQDHTSQYSGVLSRFITRMLAGERPVIYGDGLQSRDFVFVEDIVRANLLACEAPARRIAGRTFNVGTARSVTLRDAFAILKTITGYEGEPQYAPTRTGDILHSVADISAARENLGYEPAVGFEEGLRRTVEWYRDTMERSVGAAPSQKDRSRTKRLRLSSQRLSSLEVE